MKIEDIKIGERYKWTHAHGQESQEVMIEWQDNGQVGGRVCSDDYSKNMPVSFNRIECDYYLWTIN